MASAAVKLRTSVLLCLACIVEGADMAVLPALYLFIAKSLRASPSQLGVVTLCRALTQAVSSPISGVVGDTHDRTTVVAVGALIWSVCTVGVSMSTSLLHASAFSAANGLGLALVIPCAQSLMADYYPAEQRGRAFGAMSLTMSFGSMLGSLFATNVAGRMVWGVEGWRVAMRSVSAVSFLVAAAVAALATDPRTLPPAAAAAVAAPAADAPAGEPFAKASAAAVTQRAAVMGPAEAPPPALARPTSAGARLGSAWASIRDIMRIPTFQIIVAQGIVGTMPWNAIAFITLWLQLLGFSDWHASVLTAAFYGATSAGSLLGGAIGDHAAALSPGAGRIYTAQVSAASGIPLTWLLIMALPRTHLAAYFPLYLAVVLTFGVCISWCGTGCNSPLFAEIVPAHKRSLIYAFDRCFEGAVAACAAPLVGLVAEGVFGYDAARTVARGDRGDDAADAANAAALGHSLLFCLCVPWTLCFLIYFGLYRTYPADRARLKAGGGRGEQLQH